MPPTAPQIKEVILLKRHYVKAKLFNHSGRPIDIFPESVWNLPPYVIARFGGELTRVMVSAAQQYISQQCLNKQQQIFEREAFGPENKR